MRLPYHLLIHCDPQQLQLFVHAQVEAVPLLRQVRRVKHNVREENHISGPLQYCFDLVANPTASWTLSQTNPIFATLHRLNSSTMI